MDSKWRDVLFVCCSVLVALVIFFLLTELVLQNRFAAIHFFGINIVFFIVLFTGWSVIVLQYIRDVE